jgi:acyl dehydratase
MPIDYARLLAWPIPEVRQSYTEKDTMLYALGIGLGGQPTDRNQLRYVFERRLEALPMMATVLGSPGFWIRDQNTGVNWVRLLHGEQELVIHRNIPSAATIIGRSRVTGIVDKGKDKGALLFSERLILPEVGDEPFATLRSTSFCRGDGGFGGPSGPVPSPHPLPSSAPESVCDLPTLPQQALIYRLVGDDNSIHADPEVAQAAGFPRPILHGLCTFGVSGHAILRTFCDYDVSRLRSIRMRFSASVFPGETVRTEFWRNGNIISFRARIVERNNEIVINNGRAEITS